MDNYYPDFHGHTNDFGDDVGKDFARLVVPQIRMYQRDDLTKLVDIERTCFTGDDIGHAWNRSDFIRAVQSGTSIGVCLDEVRRVGFIAYEWNPTYFRIWNIAVLPGLQNRGHGTALVNHVINRMSAMRQDTLVVDVCSNLPLAQSFFFRRGFRHRATIQSGGKAAVARYILKLADTYQKYQAANVDLPNVGSPIAAP